MMQPVEHILPEHIERASFAIIARELQERGVVLPPGQESVIMRVIHTTADFDYARTLVFSDDALVAAENALRHGADIVTDTTMALAGVNKRVLSSFGGSAYCFMADESVALEARERGITRAAVSMEYALRLGRPQIIAVGNAPTALLALCNMMRDGMKPELVIGVPVGFVNVIPAKEQLMAAGVPYIVNRGRKGGSTVAAAICNALLYRLAGKP